MPWREAARPRSRCAESRSWRRRAGGAACWSRWPTAAWSSPKSRRRLRASTGGPDPGCGHGSRGGPRPRPRHARHRHAARGRSRGAASREKPSWSVSATRALQRDQITALAGWAPATAIEPLAERLAPLGGSVVEMPDPRRGGRADRVASPSVVGCVAPVGRHVRDRPVSRRGPRVVRDGRLRRHVRDDVRRRGRRAACSSSARCCSAGPAGRASPSVRQLWPLVLALGRDGGGVRPAVRGGVRSDGARAHGVDRSPRRARDAAAGRSVCRRGPARMRVRDRHRQSLAGGRSRRGAVGTERRSPEPRSSSVLALVVRPASCGHRRRCGGPAS